MNSSDKGYIFGVDSASDRKRFYKSGGLQLCTVGKQKSCFVCDKFFRKNESTRQLKMDGLKTRVCKDCAREVLFNVVK